MSDREKDIEDLVLQLKDFVFGLNDYKYVITKFETPHYSNKFPEVLPIGKDIDIFVEESAFTQQVENLKKISLGESLKRYIDYSPDNIKVRFESDFKLILQIDISIRHNLLTDLFISNCIKRARNFNSIRIPDISDEMVFRLIELELNPRKKHHYRYFLKNFAKVFKIRLSELKPKIRKSAFLLKFHIFGLTLIRLKKPIKKRLAHFRKSDSNLLDKYNEFIIQKELPIIFLDQYEGGNFNRYDALVRLLAIEEYVGLNSIGFSLYEKMQDLRSNGKNLGAKKRFVNLIESVSENGFDSYQPVLISKEGKIIDGAHRFATALHFKPRYVSVNPSLLNTFDMEKKPYYGRAWFVENGFSTNELNILDQKLWVLVDEIKAYFVAIIWSPAIIHMDAIRECIAAEGDVLASMNIHFDSKESLNIFTRQIYACDDIAAWKVERKSDLFSSYGNNAGVIKFRISEPNFRRKAINNHLISKSIERIKADIRKNFKDRIDNYVYDNIIHIGDNFTHSRHMNEVVAHFNPEDQLS